MDPAPVRQQVFSYPSPRLEDLLFYVRVDSRLPKYKRLPEKGDRFNCVFPQSGDSYPDHEFVFASPIDESGWKRYYFAAIREEQNSYNWEIRQVQGASGGFDAATRYYFVKRDDYIAGDWETTYGGDVGDPNPLAGFTLFAGEEVVPTGVKELDSCYVLVRRTYLCPDTLTSSEYNPEDGSLITVIRTVSATDGSSPLDANGIYTESQHVNKRIFINTTAQAKPFSSRSYTTVENFYWPPVLESVPILAPVVAHDGSLYKIVVDSEIRQAYNGPTKVDVLEEWFQSSPPVTDPVPDQMLPKVIQYQGMTFNWSSGTAVLHDDLTFYEILGNAGWNLAKGQVRIRTFPKTNFVDWPPTISIVSVRPYSRGGYLKTTKTYHRPNLT